MLLSQGNASEAPSLTANNMLDDFSDTPEETPRETGYHFGEGTDVGLGCSSFDAGDDTSACGALEALYPPKATREESKNKPQIIRTRSFRVRGFGASSEEVGNNGLR